MASPTIETTTPTTGATQARQAGPQDVLGGFAGAPEQIDNLIGASVTRKYGAAIEDRIDEGLAEARNNLLKEEAPPVTDDGDPTVSGEQQLIDRIQYLQRSKDNASGSVKDRIDIDIRNELAEAALLYPRFEERMAQELRLTTSVDPEYQALLQLDSTRRAASQAENDELEMLKKYSYETLGMSPTLRFGTMKWAKEFKYLESLEQETNRNNFVLTNRELLQDMSFEDVQRTYGEAMSGHLSDAAAYSKDMAPTFASIRHAASNPTLPGSIEAVAQWQNGGKQQAIAKVKEMAARAAEQFSGISAIYSDNAGYAQLKAFHDEQMQVFSAMEAGLEADDFRPSVIWESYTAANKFAFDAQHPVAAGQLRTLERVAPFVAMLPEAFDQRGKITLDLIAKETNTIAADLWGIDVGSTQTHRLPRNATPQQLDDHFNTIIASNPDNHGPGMTAREKRIADFVQLEATMDPEYLSIAKTPEDAFTLLSSQGAKARRIYNSGPVEQFSIAQTLMHQIGSDDFLRTLQTAATYGDQQNGLLNWANNMALIDGKYDGARKNLYRDFNGTVVGHTVDGGNASFVDMLDLDIDTETGKVVATLKADEAKAALKRKKDSERRLYSRAPAEVYAAGIDGQLNEEVAKLKIKAREYSGQLTADLRYKANISAAYAGGDVVPDYKNEWNQTFSKDVGAVLE